MIIFFTDIKDSLYRCEVENVIEQLCSKMGPEETENTCKAKQPAQDSDLNDEDTAVLNIGTNIPEDFDDDEHNAAQFATAGTDTPPPARPFRRSPLSAFTIRRFGLAGFDEPTGHEHRIDPPVNLERFYGVDDDDLSIITFSTNDGNSDAGLGDANGSSGNAEDDDDFEPAGTDGADIDDEDDDDDDDDDSEDDGFITQADEF